MSRRRARPGKGVTAHLEVEPTRRLVVVESVRATTTAVILGCTAALLLDVVAMLVVGAFLGEASGPTDLLGRGILAVAAIGLVLLALLAGPLATIERLVLAQVYADLDPKDPRIPGTVRVRGQLARTPFDPALVSVIALGGLALLAAIPCIALAAEHGDRLDDPLHRTEFATWAMWGVGFVMTVVACALAAWRLTVANRRWADGPGARLPSGLIGHTSPAVRTTSRAGRRSARAAQSPLDRVRWIGGALTVVGAILVFLGVYLHQPGLYADPITYRPDIERVIATGTIAGAALLAVGLIAAIAAGVASAVQTARALRRATRDPADITGHDRRLVRSATTSLSSVITGAQAMWAAVAVVALGWWFTLLLQTPGEGDGSTFAEPTANVTTWLLLAAWVVCGAALFAARTVLQSRGPALRNRFGYDLPTEPDDREYPDLPLFGQ